MKVNFLLAVQVLYACLLNFGQMATLLQYFKRNHADTLLALLGGTTDASTLIASPTEPPPECRKRSRHTWEIAGIQDFTITVRC